MNVIYAGDKNVIKCAGVSLLSLFENNKYVQDLNVLFVEDGIDQIDRKKLEEIAFENFRSIQFLDLRDMVDAFDIHDSRYPRSAYVRLFVDKLPGDRYIWIDCDTLVLGDLSDLWKTDINGYLFGAVQDMISKDFRNRLGIGEMEYYSSGVLLINNIELRRFHFAKKALEFMNEYYKNMGTMMDYADQDVINAVAKGRIKRLLPMYNVLPRMYIYSAKDICALFDIPRFYSMTELLEARNSPQIIHFTPGNYGRPWQKRCSHPCKRTYRKYMDRTVWRGEYDCGSVPFRRRMEKYLYAVLPFPIYKAMKTGYAQIKKSGVCGKTCQGMDFDEIK